jgi:two-component system, cell cycle sensor histidine kinase and response regulator CckA
MRSGICPGTKTILLAEDEESCRCVISSVLRKQGFEILLAESGTRALEVAGRFQRRIHLLLTDVTMPGVDGPTLARYLQGMRCGLRVIVMSAHPTKMLMLDQGWTFISKPFVASALVQTVREVLLNPQEYFRPVTPATYLAPPFPRRHSH